MVDNWNLCLSQVILILFLLLRSLVLVVCFQPNRTGYGYHFYVIYSVQWRRVFHHASNHFCSLVVAHSQISHHQHQPSCTTTMASQHPIPLTFHWPLQFCFYTTTAVYLLSIITGNVSQVDRLWTFLPVIYTSYYALLPYWPQKSPFPLFPYVPEGMDRSLTSEPNQRALLMLFLQVCGFLFVLCCFCEIG